MMTMQKPNSTTQSPMEKKSSDIKILKDEEIDYQNPIGSLSLFQNMVVSAFVGINEILNYTFLC